LKMRNAVRLVLTAVVLSAGLTPARAELTEAQVRELVESEMNARSVRKEKIDWNAGNGMSLVDSPNGSMKLTMYMMMRYLNQLPASQTYQDHLGRTRNIDTGHFFSVPHRVLISLQGWAYDPRLYYQATYWTVNATDKVAIIGNLSWAFSKKLTVFAGVGSLPGIRTLTYSHPFWLGTDRNMAEEFFRPGFTQGVWAAGEPVPGVNYNVMAGNNLTTLNVNATEDSRDFAYSGSLWWMPTTKEFGPKGGNGDFENHQRLATRFGTSYTQANQNRATSTTNQAPDSTQIRMADSLLPFETGAIADGVTVQDVKYQMGAADIGFKYRGWHVQGEGYWRRLSDFKADGPLPIKTVFDTGFFTHVAKMVRPKKLELYVSTAFVFADKDAGYRDSREWLGGLNWFMFGHRNCRMNLHVIEIDRSPTSSVFGYYVGGQKGTTVSASWLVNF
jgi:hypothetical protein